MKGHIVHYIVLFLILSGGAGVFVVSQGNTAIQLLIGIATSLAYMAWGIIHHVMIGDMHRKVVIEYVVISTIAIVLLVIVLGY